MTSTWSIGVGSSSKNFARRSKSVASNAAVLSAPSSLAARSRRSGVRAARISFAPSARASRAVSSPMPALPPITTTVCPRSPGSGWMGEVPVAMLMIPPFNSLKLHLPQENRLPEGQGSVTGSHKIRDGRCSACCWRGAAWRSRGARRDQPEKKMWRRPACLPSAR